MTDVVVFGGTGFLGRIYELGGPEVQTYRELVELVMRHCGRWRGLLTVPFPVWDGLAAASSVLPAPPLTEGQVALMKRDNIADPDLPGLGALGVHPTPVDVVLRRDFPTSRSGRPPVRVVDVLCEENCEDFDVPDRVDVSVGDDLR